jgi:hypothetical protein
MSCERFLLWFLIAPLLVVWAACMVDLLITAWKERK